MSHTEKINEIEKLCQECTAELNTIIISAYDLKAHKRAKEILNQIRDEVKKIEIPVSEI